MSSGTMPLPWHLCFRPMHEQAKISRQWWASIVSHACSLPCFSFLNSGPVQRRPVSSETRERERRTRTRALRDWWRFSWIGYSTRRVLGLTLSCGLDSPTSKKTARILSLGDEFEPTSRQFGKTSSRPWRQMRTEDLFVERDSGTGARSNGSSSLVK